MQREPGYYEIVLESHIEKKRICEQTEVCVSHLPDGKTLLEGRVDRAALNGILQRIADLGLTLVSVRRREEGSGEQAE